MTIRTLIELAFSVGLAGSLATPIPGCSPKTGPMPSEQRTPVVSSADAQADRLIGAMVFADKMPPPRSLHESHDLSVPSHADLEQGRRIAEPREMEQLFAMGSAAFPALVRHIGDERYSYSGIYADLLDHTVGYACFQILELQIDAWHRAAPPYSKVYDSTLGGPYVEGTLPEWFEHRKNWTLHDLQLEALETELFAEHARWQAMPVPDSERSQQQARIDALEKMRTLYKNPKYVAQPAQW